MEFTVVMTVTNKMMDDSISQQLNVGLKLTSLGLKVSDYINWTMRLNVANLCSISIVHMNSAYKF